ncbi:MAG: hypothetical protein ACYSW8_25605 [Planctomycetota bacterium]|jgi:hypothetical protein
MNSKSIALVFFMLGALLPLLACGSTRASPPNEPEFYFKEVPKPYPVVLKFAPLPPLVLPDYPPHPGPDAGEAELKEWSLEVERVTAERAALRIARIEAYEERERVLGVIEETYEIPVEEIPPG